MATLQRKGSLQCIGAMEAGGRNPREIVRSYLRDGVEILERKSERIESWHFAGLAEIRRKSFGSVKIHFLVSPTESLCRAVGRHQAGAQLAGHFLPRFSPVRNRPPSATGDAVALREPLVDERVVGS